MSIWRAGPLVSQGIKTSLAPQSPGQQSRVASCCGRVHGNGLLGTKAIEVVWPARFGAGPGQAFAAKRLDSYDRANLVTVDVDVADVRALRHRLRATVDSGLDADRQALAQGVDLIEHGKGVTTPAHDVQYRAKDLMAHVGDAGNFKSVRSNQVGDGSL